MQPKKDKSKLRRGGFTLMEIVVAMSLFVVSSMLLVDIFTITQKTQIKLSGQTRVQADARYVMEILSRYARNYMIDYQYIVDQEETDPIPHQLNYLPLKDTMGNSIIFESSVSPTYRSDQQPQVTIVLISETTSERTGEKQTNYLQTTVSSRIYKRY